MNLLIPTTLIDFNLGLFQRIVQTKTRSGNQLAGFLRLCQIGLGFLAYFLNLGMALTKVYVEAGLALHAIENVGRFQPRVFLLGTFIVLLAGEMYILFFSFPLLLFAGFSSKGLDLCDDLQKLFLSMFLVLIQKVEECAFNFFG